MNHKLKGIKHKKSKFLPRLLMLGMRGQDWITLFSFLSQSIQAGELNGWMDMWGLPVLGFQSLLCVYKTWFYIHEEQHELLLFYHQAPRSTHKHF